MSTIEMTDQQVREALAHLKGTRYTPSTKSQVTQLTGRQPVTATGDDDHGLLYVPGRVGITLDAKGIITGFSFN